MADGRLKVLIVEDVEHVLLYYSSILREVFDVEGVGTMGDGLLRLTQPPYVDAVVLDLHLPNGKGISVVQAFQRASPHTPIVCVSGFDFDQQAMIQAGAHDFLRKPFTPPVALVDAVAKAIARQKVRKLFEPLREDMATLAGEPK